MVNLQFKAQADNGKVINSWPLATVKQQLGLTSIKMVNRGNGNFAVMEKADGTYATLPVSKEMTPEQFPEAKLAQFEGDVFIIIRANGAALATV